MQTCSRFQHCPEPRAERETKATDTAVIDAPRCYHRSLDIAAAKGRRTHSEVAEQLWPGSRLACRASSLCTPRERRLEAEDLPPPRAMYPRKPRPTHLARSRARKNPKGDNSSYTNSSPAPPPTVRLAWLGPPLGTAATLRDGRTGTQCFPCCRLFWLFLTMGPVLDEFSLTWGVEEDA